jgi:hypothetical protein
MKSLAMSLALAIAAVVAIAASQETSPASANPPTPVTASTKVVTISGDVVRYEAGKTIVVRSIDGHDVTYTIAPQVAAARDVAVGRRVSIVTEPSVSGPVLVTSITTEAVAPSGQTELAPSNETKTQIAAVYGTVTGYEPGRSITLLRPNATAVTYTIDGRSTIPSSLAAGRRVVVRTITRPGLGRPLVQKVTYSRRTRSTTVK